MKNGKVYYKEPKTFLQYMINFFEDNKEIIVSKKLKESDLGELQKTIKENTGEYYKLGELWSTCIYLKQWSNK